MHKFFVLAVACACSAAHAQTPATNPMPDGSRDMYVGLGAQYAPRYEGAAERRTAAMPMLQIQWSNGVFMSGLSLGMHLSESPSIEYGPLVALAPGRDSSGTRLFRLGSVGNHGGDPTTTLPINEGGLPPLEESPPPTEGLPPPAEGLPPPTGTDEGVAASTCDENGCTADGYVNRLEGVRVIKRRVLFGGFANFYLTPQLRLTTNTLYGAGNDRNGLRMYVALQHLQHDFAPHHSLSVSAGVTLVNRAYNMAYFGVSAEDADSHQMHPEYHPDGGIADVRLGARWNWELSPMWMVTSGLQVSRLTGDAKRSPLVERPTNVSLSTALVYRF